MARHLVEGDDSVFYGHHCSNEFDVAFEADRAAFALEAFEDLLQYHSRLSVVNVYRPDVMPGFGCIILHYVNNVKVIKKCHFLSKFR